MAGPHRWIMNVAAPWEAASFDTGLLPASSEIVIFDGGSQGDVIGGLNQAAVDLAKLQIDEAYQGYIGADGAPLIISADEVIFQGAGKMTYQDGNGTTDLMIVDSPNLQDAVQITGSTITRVRVRSGRVDFLSSFTGTIAKLEIAPYGISSPIVNFQNTGHFITNLQMSGGSLSGYPVFSGGTILVLGGTMYAYGGTSSTTYLNGGTIFWNSPTTSPGVALVWSGDIHLINGIFDARVGGAKSISSLYKWDGGTFLYTNGKMTATLQRMNP